MSTQAPQRSAAIKDQFAQSQGQPPQNDFQRLLEKPNEKSIEYQPFGAADKVKLTVDIVQKLCATRTKRGETCSVRDAIRFMMMCQAKRLNPFEGDAYLIGYDTQDGPQFSLITAHQAFLKRAELHGEFDGMESGIVVLIDGIPTDREGDFHMPAEVVVGGWARVYYKTRKYPVYRRVRLSRFAKAFGVWKDDGAGMICKVAEADSLRSAFPTMLGGLYLQGEAQFDITADDFRNVVIPAKGSGRQSLVDVVPAEQERSPGEGVAREQAEQETAESEAGLAPETAEVKSPQVRLMEAVTAAGCNFSHLQAFGSAGAIPDADSLGGFREIPTDVATRLLLPKALKAVIEGCLQAKGGAA